MSYDQKGNKKFSFSHGHNCPLNDMETTVYENYLYVFHAAIFRKIGGPKKKKTIFRKIIIYMVYKIIIKFI